MSHRTRTAVRGRVGTWRPVPLTGPAAVAVLQSRRARLRGLAGHRVVAVSDVDTSSLARRVETHCRIDPYLCIAGDLHAGACVPIF